VWVPVLGIIIGFYQWFLGRSLEAERRRFPGVLMPLDTADPIRIWVARLGSVKCSSRLALRRNAWMSSRLRKCRDQDEKVPLVRIPCVWLSQPGFWLRLLATPALIVVLSTAVGARVGEALPPPERFSGLSPEKPAYLLKAEVCGEPCHEAGWEALPLEIWPGGSVAIGGPGTEIPPAGRLRLHFRNRPRTRRIVKIWAGTGLWLSAREGQRAHEITATVYGSSVEIRYVIWDESTWNVSFEGMQYATLDGRTLERHMFSARQKVGSMPRRTAN